SFKIQDVTGSLELEVLRELFTNTNRVGFKLYSLLDAQLIYSPFEPTVYRYEVKATTEGK
ncbi:phage major capsid protein, partial [Bacillus cereus]|nr:phage major capsid protein [Bacillus cereus]MEB8723055.1 phage major capsid protein [Bacillus cereus]MEC0025725.1 phage major capsid protein [Bacillus cereus]